MTREEAITVLKAFMENPLFSEVHKAAFNIAIHDIKAYQDWNINNLILVNKDNYEPTTKNDLGVELISRADLYNEIKGIDHYEETEGNESDGSLITYHTCDWNEVLRAIEEAPSVTPQEPADKNFTKADIDAIVKAINAHWELIIDEIRAEIQNGIHHFLDGEPIIEIKEVLQIIDKYKADRSEEDGNDD